MAHLLFRLVPALVIGLSACQAFQPESKAKKTEVAVFLDDLKKTPLPNGLEKTVAGQNKNETTNLPKPNLEHELSFFNNADLSESYLKGYYSVEKQKQGNLDVTIYTANDPKPDVRLLEVIRNVQGQIVGLHMESEQDNYLYKNSLKATVFAHLYEPGLKDYRVEGDQKMLFGQPYKFTIYARAL